MLTGDEILQNLRTVQLSYSDIARFLNVTPQHVRMVAHRERSSKRIAKALTIAIGKPFTEVFSDQPQYHTQRPIVDPEARAKRIRAAREALAAAGYQINTREASR